MEDRHLRIHIELYHVQGVRYVCDKCEYKCQSGETMRKHIYRHHRGSMYNCDDCKFGSSSMMTMRRHISKNHNKGWRNQKKHKQK